MKSKVISNFAYTVIYRILIVIVPLITTPYVSRVLGSSGVGLYSYTYTIAYAFSLFAGLGLSTYGQREIAYCQGNYEKRSTLFWELIWVRVTTTIVTLIAYALTIFFYKEYSYYLLINIFYIIAVPFDISWYYQGIEDFKIITIRNLVIKLLTLALIFCLVKTKDDVNLYIIINAVSILASNLIYFWKINKKISCKSIFEFTHFKKHLKGCFSFFIPLIAVELYSHLDKLMLGALTSGTSENGYYEQARKITNLILSILVSINAVLLPRISSLYAQNDKEKIKYYHKKSLEFLFLLLAPITVGLFIISDNFVIWFFGNEFVKVSSLLKVGSVLLIFMTLGNFIGTQYLTPTGKQNMMTFAYLISAGVNFILNSIFIPKYYSMGAIVASVIAESFSFGIQFLFLQKSDYRINLISISWKYILSSLIMGTVLIILDNFIYTSGISKTLIQIAFGAIIYLMFLSIFQDPLALEVIGRIKRNSK